MSSNQNRPRPNVGQGQQKVDTAVESKITPVTDISTPDPVFVPKNMDEVAKADTKKDETVALREALEEANRRLSNVQSAINNPFWTVGYLTNTAPIQRAIDGKDL